MLARRIALVVAIALLIAFAAYFAARHDGGIERRDAHHDASADAPRVAHVDLAASATDVERAVAVTSDASSAMTVITATESTGRTFAELVRPSAADTRNALPDATIVCTTADGVQRRARLDEEVLAGDVAPDGLWIVVAAGYLPAVLDSNQVATLTPDARHVPFDLRLLPRAQVALQLDAGATDDSTFERLALVHARGGHIVPDWLVADVPSSKRVPEPLHEVAIDVVRLADGVDIPGVAAVHVARIRSMPLGTWAAPSSSGSLKQKDHTERLWSAHVVTAPIGSRVDFDHVVADEDLAIIAFGPAPLVFTRTDGAPLASFARRGAVGTAPFELERGEVREYIVRRVAPAVVRGRFPLATIGAPSPKLWCEQPTARGTGIRMEGDGCDAPARDVDGSFAWAGLDPGHYLFYATWEETGGVHRTVRLEFDLAAGEVRDLGELRPAASGRLTIHPRLVSELALAAGIEPSNFTVVLHVSGPLPPDLPAQFSRAWAPMRRFVVEFDEPCVVDGIELGTYDVVAHAIRPKRAFTRPAPADVKNRALLDALKGGTDPRLYALTEPNRPNLVEVGEDTNLDVAVEVAAVGACTIVVALPELIAKRSFETRVEFIRHDGLDVQKGGHVITHVAPDGTATGARTTYLPPGEWLAIVALDIEKDRHGPAAVLVGSIDVTVASGVHTEHAALLDAAARLRVAFEFEEYTAPRLVDLGRHEHEGVVLRPSKTESVFDGLLPNTRYVFGERAIETGAPGSEVVLE